VAKEMLAGTLLSIHNLYTLVNLVKNIRQAIIENRDWQVEKWLLDNRE
jgi:tRNA-guanine family transglycosylase